MSDQVFDVAVIGLGAVGSSALYQLARRGVRAIQDNGLVRPEGADYSRCIRMDVQLKGPPNGSVHKAALRFGSPHGAAGGRYKRGGLNRK